MKKLNTVMTLVGLILFSASTVFAADECCNAISRYDSIESDASSTADEIDAAWENVREDCGLASSTTDSSYTYLALRFTCTSNKMNTRDSIMKEMIRNMKL